MLLRGDRLEAHELAELRYRNRENIRGQLDLVNHLADIAAVEDVGVRAKRGLDRPRPFQVGRGAVLDAVSLVPS
jgi:hypothetical protein